MAPVDGRNEVPDSEDEPMTSSPVNHAPMDERTDIEPSTPAASSKPTHEGSNNAANDILPAIAPHLSSDIDDPRPRQHATMAQSTQNNQHVPVGALTTGAETVTAPAAQQASDVAGDAVRDEAKTPEQQPETVDNKVAPACANEQSSYQSSIVSETINDPEIGSVPQHVGAHLSQHISNADDEVSEARSNEQSALQEESNTLVTSQHDAPLLPVPPPSTDHTTSIESKDAEHVDEATRLMQENVTQRLKGEASSCGSDAKHGIVSEGIYDNTDDIAAGFHMEPQGQSKGIDLENEPQQNASRSLTSSSGAEIKSHGGTITSKNNSKGDEADRSSTNLNTEPKSPAAASVSCGFNSKVTSFDTSMDIDIPPSDSKVENHTSSKEATASPSLSTAHNSAEQTSQDPSKTHLEMPDVPVSTSICETTKAVPGEHTTIPEPTPNEEISAQSEPSRACPTLTPARNSQEITLAELKAQKSAMLASLAALPAIQVLMEENASADVEMMDGDDEPTEADIMAAANKIVKDHIKLLHEYNELKDVGQGLMGLIADQRGVRIIEVQEEFGIEAQD